MRVIIDVGHPGDFHLFKNLAHLLNKNGGKVLFTTRQKEFEIELLRSENLDYKSFGKHYLSITGKLWGLLKFNAQMLATALKFKPDLFISHGSVYAAPISFLLGKKHLSMEDTGNMEQIALYRPFTDTILTPDVFYRELGPKQVRYNGFHEIAYLHPDHFTPDPKIYQWLGLNEGEQYAIVRFVAWKATHDIGHKGLSNEDKVKLVNKLSEKMRVFITSEAKLTDELEPYRFKIGPEKLHHALNYASIVVSEGSTVASEAGVLGTPAIYINPMPMAYCQEQEKYGLVFNTSEAESVFSLVDEILGQDRQAFREKSKKMLAEKVNVTQFLYDFIQEKYMKN
ncbi:MAG: DUF354 domain-containing protein [Saprospiraceae bacterium]|nr:DUF354 domain-containing protein [Saprospiraceae bacterium]